MLTDAFHKCSYSRAALHMKAVNDVRPCTTRHDTEGKLQVSPDFMIDYISRLIYIRMSSDF